MKFTKFFINVCPFTANRNKFFFFYFTKNFHCPCSVQIKGAEKKVSTMKKRDYLISETLQLVALFKLSGRSIFRAFVSLSKREKKWVERDASRLNSNVKRSDLLFGGGGGREGLKTVVKRRTAAFKEPDVKVGVAVGFTERCACRPWIDNAKKVHTPERLVTHHTLPDLTNEHTFRTCRCWLVPHVFVVRYWLFMLLLLHWSMFLMMTMMINASPLIHSVIENKLISSILHYFS